MTALYLDASAFVKVVVEEPGSAALRRHLARRRGGAGCPRRSSGRRRSGPSGTSAPRPAPPSGLASVGSTS